jgi:ABC-2 type transport system permease protein
MFNEAVQLNSGQILGRKLWKYFSVFRISFSDRATYLTNILARSSAVVLRIWIFVQLYSATYRMTGSSEIDGVTVSMVIWMLMLTQSFQMATRPSLAYIISQEVISGGLAYSINKPFSYSLFHFWGYLGRFLPNVLSNLIIGAVAAFILIGGNDFGWLGISLGMVILLGGLIIDFLANFCIGLLSFWVEDISAFNWIYTKSQIALGGVLIPLALFPEKIRSLVELLPFSHLFYSAARLAVGFDWELFWRFLKIQSGWILLLSLVATLIFKRGIKNVSINGG